MSNYRNGLKRPVWRGGAPGRELTKYEENVFTNFPFVDPKTGKEQQPSNSQLGYFLTGAEEEDSTTPGSLSEKYLRIHSKKYQSLALRPRFGKHRLASYYAVYPERGELPKPGTMEEASKTICVFYPDQPDLLLKAPLKRDIADVPTPELPDAESGKEGPMDPNEKNSFFELLKVHPTLCEKILNDAGYVGLASLSQSCKLGMNIVSDMMCLFDLATGDFANSEYTVPEFAALSSQDQAMKEDVPHGYKVVQVASGYLAYDRILGYQRQPTYEKLAQSIVRLTRSFRLWGHSIEHLYLTKVPFMDVKTLGMWLKEMPNLQTLTIVRCEHIRLFDMVPLVDMVHKHRKTGSQLKLDVAPFYELGPRNENFEGDPFAWEDHLRPAVDRQGTFGVTFGDPGVKIHAAVVEYLFYELLPKLEATDQMYLMSLDSLLRNYFERLPLPEHSTLRTLKAYKGAREWLNKIESLPKPVLKEDEAEDSESDDESSNDMIEEVIDIQHVIQTIKRPEFPDPASLPQEFRQEEAWERIRCYVMLAFAAFGDEDPHLQTAADSCMSSNAPLRPYSFGKWGEDKACSSCRIRMPCMFFPNACLCDKDRLNLACAREGDHSKPRKKRVMEMLGCGYINEPVKALEDTNIDFTKLYDEQKVFRLQRHADFDAILALPDSPLHQFYTAARDMDAFDPNGLKGRFQHKQLDHPYSGHSLAHHNMNDQLAFTSYRRAYTVEDFTVNKRGMHAYNTAHDSEF